MTDFGNVLKTPDKHMGEIPFVLGLFLYDDLERVEPQSLAPAPASTVSVKGPAQAWRHRSDLPPPRTLLRRLSCRQRAALS